MSALHRIVDELDAFDVTLGAIPWFQLERLTIVQTLSGLTFSD